MTRDHKTTSRRVLELWGDNTVHQPLDYLAATYVNHQRPDVAGGTSDKSLQELKALLAEFHKSFSDVKMEVLQQVEEGDVVCSRFHVKAKHSGAFENHAATGKTTSWTGVQTDRYKEDELVESWVNWDKFSFLEGLGLVS